jgi:1-aminocyclopropane-1-carboxylate deaminase/D-cysteine desulfhydrase-like pyridoxal-dependent ACC family enzyme
MTDLSKALARLPRLALAQLPTPLQHAPRLSRALGGPQIYFKRDDLTGMPLGGNKTRMFEYVLPRALAAGADCVVAGAAVQSNYCRQLTAACAHLGLDIYLLLRSARPDVEEEPQGNFLLDLLMGANVTLLGRVDWREQRSRLQAKTEQLRAEGRRPYLARMANTDDIGLDAAAYAHCALEMHDQFAAMGIAPTHVYVAAADTTQGGLVLGAKALGESYRVVAVHPASGALLGGAAEAPILEAAEKCAQELGLGVRLQPQDIVNHVEYAGEGYAAPTPEGLAAVRLVASHEGILLDPVYTGKAMAALIDHIRRGLLQPGDTVVFLHTGGYPALFAYSRYFNFDDQIGNS